MHIFTHTEREYTLHTNTLTNKQTYKKTHGCANSSIKFNYIQTQSTHKNHTHRHTHIRTHIHTHTHIHTYT